MSAMLALGQFVFGLHTAAYQELQQSLSWRYSSNNRVGLRAARQFVGQDESISLTGVLAPEITGGLADLTQLRRMGDSGKAWPLLDGGGTFLGLFVIESLENTRTLQFADGAARRIEFSLLLTRVDDDRVDLLGSEAI